MTTITVGGTLGIFVPFNMAFKTNLITDAADEYIMSPYHLVSPANIDVLRLGIPISAGCIAYTVYLIMNYTNGITSQYISKMSYSKDKVFQIIYVGINLHQEGRSPWHFGGRGL